MHRPNASDTGRKEQEAQARQLSQTPCTGQTPASQDGKSRKPKPGSSVELHPLAKHQRHRTERAGSPSPAAQSNSTRWPNNSDTGRKQQGAQARQLSRTPRIGQTPATQDGRSRKRKPGSSVKLHKLAKHQHHRTVGAGSPSPAAQSNSTRWPNNSDTGRKEQGAQAQELSRTPPVRHTPATQDGRSRKRKLGSSVELHALAKHQRHRTEGAGSANSAAQSNSARWPNTSNTGRKEQEAQGRQLSRTPCVGQTPVTQDRRSRKCKPSSSVELHALAKYQQHRTEGAGTQARQLSRTPHAGKTPATQDGRSRKRKLGSSVELHALAKHQRHRTEGAGSASLVGLSNSARWPNTSDTVELHALAKHQRHRTEGAGSTSLGGQSNSARWPNTSNTGRKEQEAQGRQLSRTPCVGQTPVTQDRRSRKCKPSSSVELHTLAKYQRHRTEGAGTQARQLSRTPHAGKTPATQDGRSRKRKPGISVELHTLAKHQ